MKHPSVIGLYLAGGSSRRMGCNKLALPFLGATLGSMALKSALSAKLTHVLVLTRTGDSLSWIPSDVFHSDFGSKLHHIPCERSTQGQSETIRCGLDAARNLGADAVVVMLADQPYVTVDILNHIVDCYRESLREGRDIRCIASSCQGIIGPPILFSYQLFPILLSRLHGDEGVRRLWINGALLPDVMLEVVDARVFQDIDTMNEYRHFLSSG